MHDIDTGLVHPDPVMRSLAKAEALRLYTSQPPHEIHTADAVITAVRDFGLTKDAVQRIFGDHLPDDLTLELVSAAALMYQQATKAAKRK